MTRERRSPAVACPLEASTRNDATRPSGCIQHAVPTFSWSRGARSRRGSTRAAGQPNTSTAVVAVRMHSAVARTRPRTAPNALDELRSDVAELEPSLRQQDFRAPPRPCRARVWSSHYRALPSPSWTELVGLDRIEAYSKRRTVPSSAPQPRGMAVPSDNGGRSLKRLVPQSREPTTDDLITVRG